MISEAGPGPHIGVRETRPGVMWLARQLLQSQIQCGSGRNGSGNLTGLLVDAQGCFSIVVGAAEMRSAWHYLILATPRPPREREGGGRGGGDGEEREYKAYVRLIVEDEFQQQSYPHRCYTSIRACSFSIPLIFLNSLDSSSNRQALIYKFVSFPSHHLKSHLPNKSPTRL